MPERDDTPTADDLQFDHAEPEAPASGKAMTCSGCERPIRSRYFEVNGDVVCQACERKLAKTQDARPGVVRPAKALGLGVAAAAVGAGIYYAIVAITGYEIGLVAIVVGILVGVAVKIGSDNVGGIGYQALAVVLTYCAIVSTYMPIILDAAYAEMEKQQTPAAADAGPTGDGGAADPVAPEPTEPSDPPTVGEYVTAYAELFWFAARVPFMAVTDNLIGLLIIGFALFQAWVIPRRTVFEISGPFEVGDAERT